MAQAWRECMLLGIPPSPAALPFVEADTVLRSCMAGSLEAEFRIHALGIKGLAPLLRRTRRGDDRALVALTEALAVAFVRQGNLEAAI